MYSKYNFHKGIHLEEVHIERTYGGCLEGVPDRERLISSARSKAAKFWGGHVPQLILNPEDARLGVKYNFNTETKEPFSLLPEWKISVLLLGPAVEEEDDGTHLAVVYFTDSPCFEIEPLLDKFNWNEHARGFGF